MMVSAVLVLNQQRQSISFHVCDFKRERLTPLFMVGELFQNSTKNIYSTSTIEFTFKKNTYSTSTIVFTFKENIYSTSTIVFTFKKNIYSTS